jgi:hypothetical protein
MSSTYTGNPNNNPATITIPSDGDTPLQAADVNVPLEGLADQVAHLQRTHAIGFGAQFSNPSAPVLAPHSVNTKLLEATVTLPNAYETSLIDVVFGATMDMDLVTSPTEVTAFYAKVLSGSSEGTGPAQVWHDATIVRMAAGGRITVSIQGKLAPGAGPPITAPNSATSVIVQIWCSRSGTASGFPSYMYSGSISGVVIKRAP